MSTNNKATKPDWIAKDEIDFFNDPSQIEKAEEIIRTYHSFVKEDNLTEANEWALSFIGKALKVNPDSILYHWRGLIYAESSKFSEAIKDLTRAIELNPYSYASFMVLGGIYFNQNNFEKALPVYQTFLENSAGQSLNWIIPIQLKIANCHYEMNQCELVITSLPSIAFIEEQKEKGLSPIEIFDALMKKEIDVLFVMALNLKGKAYLLLSKKEEALLNLNKALELDPDNKEAMQLKESIV